MLGPKQEAQGALFYEFLIEGHVPQDHLLRSIDRFVDLTGVRQHLTPFDSTTGRPSVDPELMIRMLLVGYCLGMRSERRLCEEVCLNLAYRWFCRLDLVDPVPDHSAFSRNRPSQRCKHRLPGKCMVVCATATCCGICSDRVSRVASNKGWEEGPVSGLRFAVDASLIVADTNR